MGGAVLRRLTIRNFRSHVDTSVELDPITVFVGPLAGGKSNLFRALLLLQNSVSRSLVELFPPGTDEFRCVHSRWSAPEDPMRFEIEWGDHPAFRSWGARYVLEIADSPKGPRVTHETVEQRQPGQDWRKLSEASQVSGPSDQTMLNRLRSQNGVAQSADPDIRFALGVAAELLKIGYYHLEVSRLKSPGTGQPVDRITYRGEHLPDFLARLRDEPDQRPRFAQILSKMKQLLPDLQDILVTRVRPDEQRLQFYFPGARGYLSADEMSDGTMLSLGLLCATHAPAMPAVLCLEEPETGIHPGRLRWLFDELVQLSYPPAGGPGVQVLVSTHSPNFLDLFRDVPDAVRIVECSNGRTRVSSLVHLETQVLRHPMEPNEPIGQLWATGVYEGL